MHGDSTIPDDNVMWGVKRRSLKLLLCFPSPDFSQKMQKSGSKTAKIYITQVFQQFKHDPE
ncbi:hypothetical protein [Nodularia sp. NIES-3585]|uniref:hypothetical protein n=1 Tax=Nodularia sp. NIES-3585 TaxID=1973477 RepID=UPI0011327066|nr:hypothetical protein [Nodularia sp. NIES-3585]